MKNMFFRSGLINPEDGRCGNCPFGKFSNGRLICSETGMDVSRSNKNGRINKDCPFIEKEDN